MSAHTFTAAVAAREVDGRYVAGADRLRTDGDGKVREITVVGRPLTGLAGFLSGAGYHFAQAARPRRREDHASHGFCRSHRCSRWWTGSSAG